MTTAFTDIATRTYNHGWRLDPIVRSLLDTDFYKLLMQQMIREFYPDTDTTFSVINRSTHVRLAEVIDEGELRAQLDHARTIRFAKKELIWLAGNTFYGKTQMFSPDFINWLSTFQLPEYELRKVEGQYELHFHGKMDQHHHVGDPGARDHERVALARGDERARPLCARCALRARQGKTMGQGGAAEEARQSQAVRLRHEAAPWLSLAALVLRGGQGRPGVVLHRHLQRAARDGQRPRGDRHQCARTADGRGRPRRRRHRAALGALPHPRSVAAHLWRQSPDRAAGCVRHPRFPARRTRLGRRLDRLSPRQRPADPGRRGDHPMVEGEGPRPQGETASVLRRHGCRFDRGDLSPFRRPRPLELRLGHQPHQ